MPGLRIKEAKEVYEGEVTELTPEETENPLGGASSLFVMAISLFYFLARTISFPLIHHLFIYIFPHIGYGKTVSHVIIGLKTTKGTKQLKVP